MTNQAYLEALLETQRLMPVEEERIGQWRLAVERALAPLVGNPRFYYAGSYGKRTIIRDAYDLDVVVYWPHDCGYALRDIFQAVGDQLRRSGFSLNAKTVSWEIPIDGSFHVDVVPGRALDSTFMYANLYRRDRDSSLQTSIKVHIRTIRDSGRRDAIRLIKLWKARKGVPIKTFLLELMTIDGCRGEPLSNLERQLIAAFAHLRDNILTARVLDPANTNNVISDDIADSDKLAVQRAAQAALDARYWSDVF